jgi:hypothetical protein
LIRLRWVVPGTGSSDVCVDYSGRRTRKPTLAATPARSTPPKISRAVLAATSAIDQKPTP